MKLLKKFFLKSKKQADYTSYGQNAITEKDGKFCLLTSSVNSEKNLNELNKKIVKTFQEKFEKDNVKGILREVLKEINDNLYMRGEKDISLVSFYQEEKKLIIAHIGNTKLYAYNSNEIKQITEEDTEGFQLFKSGILTYERLQSHPFNNILSNSLGKSNTLTLNMHEYFYMEGDKILLGDNDFFKNFSLVNMEDILSGSRGIEKIAEDFKENLKNKNSNFIIKSF